MEHPRVLVALISAFAVAAGTTAVLATSGVPQFNAPSAVVPAEPLAGDVVGRIGSTTDLARPARFGAARALAALSPTRGVTVQPSGLDPASVPLDTSLADDTLGPEATRNEMLPGRSGSVTALSMSAERSIAAASLQPDRSNLPPIAPAEDDHAMLAQSPPSSEGPAAPDAQSREADLAKQLANPISSLISVPFQQNIQFGIGPANAGWQDLMNIQPVVPLSISADWNLVARMIMPVVYQDEIFPGAGSQFGIGDTTFQFFFSPKVPTKDGLIWGIGPLFFVPSGAYLLSTSTWGAGVDLALLKQVPKPYWGGGILTYGALVTQTWPVSGAAPINTLFLQPFVSYTLKNTVTFNLQSQATYNWTQSQWTVPLIASVGKIYRFGNQLTQLSFGVKYYPVRPITAPQWGVQLVVTLLFPKR